MTVSELPFAWIMLTMDGRVAESHPSRDLGARHFWEAMTPWAVPEMGHRGLTPTRLGCVSTCARLERQSPRGVSLARMLAPHTFPLAGHLRTHGGVQDISRLVMTDRTRSLRPGCPILEACGRRIAHPLETADRSPIWRSFHGPICTVSL